jgi:hypothetical protein
MKLTCPRCGHSAAFPDNMPAHEVLAKLKAAPETEMNERLDRTGSVRDAQLLLQQRRRRPGMKPNAVV